MGAFKSAVITKKGQALLAKVIAGTAKFNFTSIKTSENILTGDIASMTGIGTIKQTANVASVIRQNDSNVKVSASFSNTALKTGYYVRNLGLYAIDPADGEILYSVSVADESTATADWMPPFNGIGVSSLMVDLVTAVSNATSVNVIVDPTAVATVSQLKHLYEQVVDEFTTVKRSQGTHVIITDSANEPFVGIRVLGKSTQQGEPSPDSPKEITSVGDIGSVTVDVYGKNLYDAVTQHSGKNLADGWMEITADNISGNDTKYTVLDGVETNLLKPSTKYTVITEIKSWSGKGFFEAVTTLEDKFRGQFTQTSSVISGNGIFISHLTTRDDFSECLTMLRSVISVEAGNSLSFKFRISVVEEDYGITANTFTYRPFTKQTLSLSTPNCLRGVKAKTDLYVNYTDADGNKWICDEVDLSRGVYIKKVGTVVIDGTLDMTTGALGDGWYRHHVVNYSGLSKVSEVSKISNRYPYVSNYTEKSIHFYVDSAIWIFNKMTHDEFMADLKNNPITIVGGLGNSEEIPLTKDEIFAYHALHSNNPVTHIVNDVGADMDIEYYNKTSENILKPIANRINYMEKQVNDIKTSMSYEEDGEDEDIYGVEVDFSSKTITRIAGAVNLTQGADFDALDPWGGRKRCILTDDGVRLAYYGDIGYTESGSLTQDITVGETTYPIGTPVQVMVEQPIFYVKAVPVKAKNATSGKGKQYVKARFYISPIPKNDFSIPRAFYDMHGIPQDKIYLSAYEGSLYREGTGYITDDGYTILGDLDKLCSIAGVKPASGLSNPLTRANVRKLCNNRGEGWQLHNIFAVAVTEWLFMVEYASLDPQRKIGYGVSNIPDGGGGNQAINTGATSSIGNGSGFPAGEVNGKCSVTYRGEENLWGNIWTWLDCVNILAKGVNEVWVTKIGTAPVDDTTEGYECLSAHASHTDGFISAFGIDSQHPEILIPTEALGSDTFADQVYQNYTADGFFVAVFGGFWFSSTSCGFSFRFNYDSAGKSRAIGGRLLYVPQSIIE